MPLLGRSDGTYVRDVTVLRRMMPHVMPTRTGATVYFDQQLVLTRTLPWLEANGVSLFELLLCGYVRAIAARPQMNRFVVGRRLYQRKQVELSFAVKKKLADGAAMTTVKVRFEPTDDPQACARRVRETIQVGRGEAKVVSEKEMAVVSRLPRAVVRLAMWAQRVLDYWNLLPGSMIRNDPLYASMVVANLGSVGLEAAYHHLYEYGTVSLFAAIGRMHKAQVVAADGVVSVADVVDIRYSFDERIADGWYAARTLDLFKAWVEDPDTMD